MGRGDSNLLGPLFPASRAKPKKKEKTEESSQEISGNILFAPPQKQDSDLYAKNPSGAALSKARAIIKDIKAGKHLSLLMALDKEKKYMPGKSPALDLIFTKIFSEESNKVLRPYKLSKRDKAVKREREAIDKEGLELLAERTKAILDDNLSADAQIERMKKELRVDNSLITEISLRSEEKGPIHEVLLGQIATTPLEDLNPETLSFMLKRGAPKEADTVFQEIIRRQILAQIKRNLPYTTVMSRNLNYGMLRASSKKPGLIHLVEGTKTICGKRGARSYRLEYGDWTDGVRAGNYKRCPKCEAAAPEDLKLRVEAEHSDRGADIFSLARQEEIADLARDPGIKSLVRAGLRKGKPPYEISEEVDGYLLRKAAAITARAADEGALAESKGRIASYGGKHILWDSIPYELNDKIRKAGYEGASTTYSYRSSNKSDKREDDEMLHLTTTEERAQALLYKIKANETDDYQKSNAWHKKSEEIVARGIRRTLRRERDGKGKDGKGKKDGSAAELF